MKPYHIDFPNVKNNWKDIPRNLMPRLPDSYGRPRSTPGARSTPRLRPRATSATSTIGATVVLTSTKGCAEATTPGVGDATTAGRIGVLRPSHPVRRLSVGPSDGRHSRPGSDPRLLSRRLEGNETGTVARAELLVNGKRVENDLTFTAEDSKMEVQIEFIFNASELGGKELVTFEEMCIRDRNIAFRSLYLPEHLWTMCL